MKMILKILSWAGLGVAVLLLVVGLSTVGVLAAAHMAVAPAEKLLRVAAGGAPPLPTETPTKPEGPGEGVMYSTPERVLNLSDQGGKRYLKVQVVLEFATATKAKSGPVSAEAYKKMQEDLGTELVAKTAVIDDQINTILSGKVSTDLMTPGGKAKAKEEIRDSLVDVLGDKQLLNVYFTQFVIE
jgi:flagellar protein FliL